MVLMQIVRTEVKGPMQNQLFSKVDSVVQTKPDLEEFWKIESLGISEEQDGISDKITLTKFKETVRYDNRMYHVTLPWKETAPELPDTRDLALARLRSNVARMRNKPDILDKNNNVIKEQLSKGMSEPVETNSTGDLVHYIPNHAVITTQKSTTKLRVVYDASAKTKAENRTLNDSLYRGPVMLHDLCGLLMRFRLNRIALVSDIEKAFLQIGLQPSQRDVTRFLWIKNIKQPVVFTENIQEYRFCRVPVGVISSPFLLGATIESHLERYDNSTAEKIKDNIYVDNVIMGTNTWPEAFELYTDSKKMFNDASMNLREWASNSKELMEMILSKVKTDDQVIKVLGHTWITSNDTLALCVTDITCETRRLTKRIMLKQISSVFDPLGLLCPVVLKGKILLQSIWKKQIGWDDR
ncbi:uncharacterized protein LOC123545213 [Mercenaria mercenaria]|uniref:uncharacterized protein LOC123545213 n=1 Tax=Mercenaria mercenaria TaxID=6596 RepID=UPI001E1D44EC|nr:uncharacterized protein LOC123545213 [Mercenaria mercenaria]